VNAVSNHATLRLRRVRLDDIVLRLPAFSYCRSPHPDASSCIIVASLPSERALSTAAIGQERFCLAALPIVAYNDATC